MTENIEDATVLNEAPEETIDLGELNPEDLGIKGPDGVTAFLIIKKESGDWYATAELGMKPNIQRPASMEDIKHGCQDIVESMLQTNIAFTVTNMLKGYLATPEAEKDVSSSIREALAQRDIL